MSTQRKIFLVSLIFLCLIVVVGKIYGEKEGDKKESVQKEATLSDIKIQGATQDYIDAYNLFLKANVTDVGENTYSKAIEALKKASQTKNPEEKLNCLFLISFSYFLDGNTEEAYKIGLEALSLAKTIFKDNANISLLDKIKLAIENKQIIEIAEIADIMNLGEQATGLMMDLYELQERRNEYPELVKKCWEKFKPEFDKKISTLAKENNLSAEATEKIKRQLEEKYREKGYFLPVELENVIY